jgi:hypothetical protein
VAARASAAEESERAIAASKAAADVEDAAGCTIGAASSRMMTMIEVANALMQRDGWCG